MICPASKKCMTAALTTITQYPVAFARGAFTLFRQTAAWFRVTDLKRS